MCSGGRLVADFVAGTKDRPELPDVAELADSLTTTTDGAWVVRAYKVAREDGDRFVPLTGRGSYPADAQAECLANPRPVRRWQSERPGHEHAAPDPACTCGFHALSGQSWRFPGPGLVRLTVVLSGRVLAFETIDGAFAWGTAGGNVLFPRRSPNGRTSGPGARRLRRSARQAKVGRSTSPLPVARGPGRPSCPAPDGPALGGWS